LQNLQQKEKATKVAKFATKREREREREKDCKFCKNKRENKTICNKKRWRILLKKGEEDEEATKHMNKQSKQHQHPAEAAAAAAAEAGEEAAETKVHNGVGCMTGSSRKYLVID
jgi:hypothetical protein